MKDDVQALRDALMESNKEVRRLRWLVEHYERHVPRNSIKEICAAWSAIESDSGEKERG